MWDKTKAIPALESYDPDVLFVCGCCRNRGEFGPYFTKVFNLKIDDNTMRKRLAERTNNEFDYFPGKWSQTTRFTADLLLFLTTFRNVLSLP